MITPDQVQRVCHVIDSSGVVDILAPALRTNPRGRPSDPSKLRLFLIGMLLSIRHNRSGVLRDAHRTLTEEIDLHTQFELGVRRRLDNGGVWVLPEKDLNNWSVRIENALSYDYDQVMEGTATDEDRRRHGVVMAATNALLDVFDFGWSSTVMALDATGHKSWAVRGPKNRPDAVDLEVPAETQAVLWNRIGDDDSDDINDGDVDAASEPNGRGTRRVERRVDPDATWGAKTGKNGSPEHFYGYHEHTLVLAPDRSSGAAPEPPLIRRLAVSPASKDVVPVSLALIDSLPAGAVTDLLVDMHYSFKQFKRWKSALSKRKIRQHHDLRVDEQGFTEYERMRFAAGRPHCPSTPDELGVLSRPNAKQGSAEMEAFREAVALRQQYAFRVVKQPDATATARYECPAHAGTVGCPLVAGTVEAMAALAATPPPERSDRVPLRSVIIEEPPEPNADGVLPKCCTTRTVQVDLPDPIAKLAQPRYWGSDPWVAMYNRRTYVEGCYGNRRNRQTENMTRGVTRSMGLVRTTLVYVLTAVSYNMRMVANWHRDTGLGDPQHPLLRPEATSHGFVFLTAEQAAAHFDDHVV